MTRSIDLYELQETDSATDAADQRLAEIAAELEDEPDLSEAEARLNQLTEELEQARAEQRAADDAVVDKRAEAGALEQKLYGGSVKIPKELKSLQEDLQAHQRQVSSLEDRSLAAMARIEQAQASIAAIREEHETNSSERRSLVSSLESERAALDAELQILRTQRERRMQRVDAPDLALYERLRRARGGRAVAKVERGTCQGCRISLPTTVFQRARSGLKIVQCTSCERILYVV